MAVTNPPWNRGRQVSFAQGWRWLLQAADQIAQRPLHYAPAVGWLVIIGSLQWLIPGLGAFLSGLLAPLSIAPLLLTFAAHHQGQERHGFNALEQIFHRATLLPLIRLGFYLMLVVLLLSQASGVVMSRVLDPDLQQALSQQDLSVLLSTPKHSLMLILILTALPIATLGLFAWFSVPLVLFQQAPIPHVLWYSMRACITNWRALLALNALLIVVVLGAMVLLLIVSAVTTAVSATLGLALNTLLLLASSLFLQASLAGAQYLAFHQVFPPPSPYTHPPDDNGHYQAPDDHSLKDSNQGYWQA